MRRPPRHGTLSVVSLPPFPLMRARCRPLSVNTDPGAISGSRRGAHPARPRPGSERPQKPQRGDGTSERHAPRSSFTKTNQDSPDLTRPGARCDLSLRCRSRRSILAGDQPRPGTSSRPFRGRREGTFIGTNIERARTQTTSPGRRAECRGSNRGARLAPAGARTE